MTASATQPLGTLGAAGQPLAIQWHWAYSFLPLYPWLALLLLFLLKPNQSLKAATVLVAAAISMAIVWAANQAASQFSMLLTGGGSCGISASFVFALTVLMLVSYRCSSGKNSRGFPAAVLLLASLAGIVLQYWPFPVPDMENLTPELWQCAYNILFFQLGLFVARRVCRRTFSALRLTLSFALAPLLAIGGFMIFVVGGEMFMMGQFGMAFMFIGALVAAVAWPLLFALVLLPFILLISRNPLYAERMSRALRIPAISPAPPEPVPLPLPDNAPAIETSPTPPELPLQ